MIKITRYRDNPILKPNEDISWQAISTFNACPLKDESGYHFVFRALSAKRRYYDKDMEISQVGYAFSPDGIHLKEPRLLLTPEYNWEQFGCEDPRLAKINDDYYIFYTALSDYPPSAEGIKIGVAITQDFSEVTAKHQVTAFNSKAMVLFPETINGQNMALLTVNPDIKPAKIAVFPFKKIDQLWSPESWRSWLNKMSDFELDLQRQPEDHIEVGAPPLKTDAGWLLVYSYIQSYLQPPPVFGIEAALLDLKNPVKVLARTESPLLTPKEEYERFGLVPNVVFPTGAILEKGIVKIYYGAADTTCCLAEIKLDDLLEMMLAKKNKHFAVSLQQEFQLEKHAGNPIISPIKNHDWESEDTFNPGAVWENGKVHLLYRAMGHERTSVLGYANSLDGLTIKERLDKPVYVPRKNFEKKAKPGFSGCEDPRITKLGRELFMCYTAYDGVNPTEIAFTTIKISDFRAMNWRWQPPKVISCPQRSDKNAGIFPEKINRQFIFFHRIGGCIWLDYVRDLNFGHNDWVGGKMIVYPTPGNWDSQKVGIAGPPIKTNKGWLIIYHGLSREDDQYRLGAFLLNLQDPRKVIAKLPYPILEPTEKYEKEGQRPNTVFSCGAVVIKKKLFVYYGAADHVIGVATGKLDNLLSALDDHQLKND